MISKPLRSQFMFFTGSLLQSIDWVFKPGDSKSQPRGWKTKPKGQKLHSEHELHSQRLKNAILRFQFQRSGIWRSEKSTYMNRLLLYNNNNDANLVLLLFQEEILSPFWNRQKGKAKNILSPVYTVAVISMSKKWYFFVIVW